MLEESELKNLNESQQNAYALMDEDQRKLFERWLRRKPVTDQSLVPSQNPTEGLQYNADESRSQIQNEVLDPEGRVFTVTRTTKDTRGYYLTETKTYIKPRTVGKPKFSKTITLAIGNVKLVAYRLKFIEDGTLGLISAKRGSDISDDPVKISRPRAEELFGWLAFVLRESRMKYHPDVEIPTHIRLPKDAKAVYRRFLDAEKDEQSHYA
jgi:hypothetical protein